MRKPSKREWMLIALVPVVIIAAAAADPAVKSRPATAEPQRDAATRTEKRHVAATEPADLTPPAAREAGSAEVGNVFASKSWYVPPPPPPPPAAAPPGPPPKPTAPPLPFTYLGKYQDTGAPVIFLVRGDRILTVKQGDVIEGNYRVDGIAGSTLTLTYMPLDIKQTLNIGTAG
jgi:hypothetical protein